MTDSTSDRGVPAKARPTVFHHEGRRLFLIDGEPRVADEDLASDLEMARMRNIRKLIGSHRASLLMLGSIVQVDPAEGTLLRHEIDGSVQPLRDAAVAGQVFDLLKAEGLIDPSKRGEKPKVMFLNAEQAKFMIVSSGMPKGRDLLVDLIKLEKAWRDGTLEPARPAVEPPPAAAAPKAIPAHIAPHRMTGQMDFCHFEGILFSFAGDGWMHVWGGSVAEALGLGEAAFAAELAKWPQLGLLGEMPSLEGRPSVWLKRAHLTFLLSRPGGATQSAWRIADVMTAQADDRAWVSDGELYLRYPAAVLGPKEGRQCARLGADMPWAGAPCDFLSRKPGRMEPVRNRV